MKMKWRKVFLFAASGILYGALTVSGAIQGFEYWVALATIALVGKFMALSEPDAPIKHSFLAGLFTGVSALLMQAILMPVYMKNNPAYRSVEVPFGLDPAVYTALFAPIGGLLAGVIAVLVAWPVSKLYLALRTV